MKLLAKIKEFLFPTITPPEIGERYLQIGKDWVDTSVGANIIEVVNVSKDGKHIQYDWVCIEGKEMSISARTTYEMSTHHLYNYFEKHDD
ncbi:hypothetical protein phiST2_0083 [Vibrio phage phi-ST2]|nr:hypothetical protein phiST2_0083 [Vibrio phage phi-ST2]